MNKRLIDKLPLVQHYYGSKEHKIVRDLLGVDYWEVHLDDLSRNEFLIYLDFKKPIVLHRTRGGKSLHQMASQLPDFKSVLQELPEINFDSILFALTLYGVFAEVHPIKMIHHAKTFSIIPEIEDILKPTYGYLLYGHQFEQIYSRLPSALEAEVVGLRKDWNKKKHEAIELVKQTEINPGFSFYDLLIERTVEENHFVWNANFKGAKLLWNYLNKIQSKTSLQNEKY